MKELSNTDLIKQAPSIGINNPSCGVSERLTFVATIKIVDFLKYGGWVPVMATQGGAKMKNENDYQTHLVRFTRPQLIFDSFRMDLLLYCFYHQGFSFKLSGGVFRFIGKNHLVIGDRFTKHNHEHTKFNHRKFTDFATKVGDHLFKISQVIWVWSSLILNEHERQVFSNSAYRLIYESSEKAPIDPHQLLTRRRPDEKGKNDLWSTFNIVQANMIKGGLQGKRRNGKNTRTRRVESIYRDWKLNQGLWMIADKTARQKIAPLLN